MPSLPLPCAGDKEGNQKHMAGQYLPLPWYLPTTDEACVASGLWWLTRWWQALSDSVYLLQAGRMLLPPLQRSTDSPAAHGRILGQACPPTVPVEVHKAPNECQEVFNANSLASALQIPDAAFLVGGDMNLVIYLDLDRCGQRFYQTVAFSATGLRWLSDCGLPDV
ncbi:hypothetical protein NDU88_002675 [Pleurodeles waltl]|uniref:Uncharacterized protein n=1 Tax=Pleurodeles waltl TaxID=8319 RepID=A0AAV7UXX8_PLEWA|nr:hypothetical protein NDU88_002675 [Pleurodeles waltl]